MGGVRPPVDTLTATTGEVAVLMGDIADPAATSPVRGVAPPVDPAGSPPLPTPSVQEHAVRMAKCATVGSDDTACPSPPKVDYSRSRS